MMVSAAVLGSAVGAAAGGASNWRAAIHSRRAGMTMTSPAEDVRSDPPTFRRVATR